MFRVVATRVPHGRYTAGDARRWRFRGVDPWGWHMTGEDDRHKHEGGTLGPEDVGTDDTGDGVGVGQRDRVLAMLEDALEEAHRKVTNGRVRDAENERVRQQWIKTLAYTANVTRQCLNDAELQELQDRIEQLEETGSTPSTSTDASGEVLIDGTNED